jgi:DNA-binding transcriptional MerR regulator
MIAQEQNDPESGELHTIEAVATLTGASRREILRDYQSGLLLSRAAAGSETLMFDDEAVYRVRRIEHLRSVQGINLAGIRLIFELMNEVRRLEDEMRFLRP